MQGNEQFQLMARYNHWMNEKVYAVCADIPDVDRRADRGAFFDSIHGTLNHLFFGDHAWMNRLAGTDYPVKPIGEPIYDSFEEMQAARGPLDEAIIAWADSMTADWLATELTWNSFAYKRTFTHTHGQLVAHVFNHQTHHRGQITTLLSQMGLDVGATDIPVMPGA